MILATVPDPIVTLVTPSSAALLVWGIWVIVLILSAPLLQWVRDWHDDVAEKSCNKRFAEAEKLGDESAMDLWKWDNYHSTLKSGAFLTGVWERLFFSLAAYFWMPGFVVAAIAWVGLKMLPGWTAHAGKSGGHGAPKMVAFSRLRTSFVSIALAVLIGVACRAAVFSMN
jgi:hypothetical protein